MKLFLVSNGIGGIAVKNDGDVVSVFKNPKIAKEYNLKNIVGKLLFVALKNGGKKLDCYDGVLPDVYIKHGFVPVSKIKFNDGFASEKWNYERDGRPDIIFFKHNGDSIDKILNEHKDYKKYKDYNIKYSNSYDKAKKIRDISLVKKKKMVTFSIA
jgi:hypothetical protein